MSDQHVYPVDPMVSFYAAITAIENGSVGEIELEFRFALPESEVTMTMVIRREVRQYPSLETVENEKKDRNHE